MFDRQIQICQDKQKDADQEVSIMSQKIDKLESQLQESGFVHKRESEEVQDRYQEMCSKYDKQVREMRTQINLKGKDI